MLADAGADISARDKYGNNVLLAAEPRFKDVACLIQLYGFSVNDRNQNETILHRAVNASEVATVMYLLENGADVFAVNSNGNTPLQEHRLPQNGY
jgi:ankyrin repeat protein